VQLKQIQSMRCEPFIHF